MKKRLHFLIIFALVASFSLVAKNYKVSNFNQLNAGIKSVAAGDSIIMANGIWKDVQIVFKGNGKKGKYISLKAETPGKVLIQGESSISLSGNWLYVSGLVFTKGYTPGTTTILFKTSDTDYAYNCVVSNCVIDKFNQPYRETIDNWVALWGKNNSVEYCYFGGKTNEGCTFIVCPNDSNSIHNKHHIYRNYFGLRPRLGSNGGESMRLGTGEVCTFSSETVVEENYFEHCRGEVEIISNKSCNNQFINNTFFESEGSLVLRHGNNALVKGNWFIGNGKPFTGGIRIINEGHRIFNNYFYKLRGDEFRSPLTIMNAIPDSPPTGYAAVKNVILSNNTWYDCSQPWNLCVGVGERNRIVTPQSTQLINNIVYCPNDTALIKSYDKTDGITFSNNLMISKKGQTSDKGAIAGEVLKSQVNDIELVYSKIPAPKVPFISSDIMGQPRMKPVVGAFQDKDEKAKTEIASANNCGPRWYKPDLTAVKKEFAKGKTIKVEAGTDNLAEAVSKAQPGDIIMLSEGEHILTKTTILNKSLTITSSSKYVSKPVIKMKEANGENPLFEISSDVYIRFKGLKIDGEGHNKQAKTPKYAFATGEHALGYSLFIDNCEIFDFSTEGGSVFNSLYCTMADSIVVKNSVIRDSYSGFNLHKEKEDGRYSAETVIFNNSVFANLSDYALDYYRGGYDESTIGGELAINHCVFDSIGTTKKESVLKLSRIMFVKINNSIFSNSPVKSSMLLWGLYDKDSRCCFYNCPKPELIKDARTTNPTFDNPLFVPKAYSISANSPLKGKAVDGSNIGLRK
ncbi:MAG: chondroitinase-B domain-containing protein [Paludibacter sp.]